MPPTGIFLPPPSPCPFLAPPCQGKDKHPPLGSFLLLFSLPPLLQPPWENLYVQPPFSFLIPLFTLFLSSPRSPYRLRRKAQGSVTDSFICSKHPECLSRAGPVTGPEDTAMKETLYLPQCYTIVRERRQAKRQVHHRFIRKSCMDRASCQAVWGGSGHRGQRTS